MKLVKAFALLFAAGFAISTVVIAQDGAGQASDRPRSRARLVKPWSQLKTLSEDQKEQIIQIHGEALDAMRKIREKEQADIMAILTPENTAELEALKEQERAEQKARRAAQRDDENKDEDEDDKDK